MSERILSAKEKRHSRTYSQKLGYPVRMLQEEYCWRCEPLGDEANGTGDTPREAADCSLYSTIRRAEKAEPKLNRPILSIVT